MLSKVYILLVVSLRFLSLYGDEALKICLKDLGCLQGTYKPGYQSERFEAYMGVPYAKPPTGQLRFQNPERITAWTGVLAATKPKPDCLQKNYILPSWPISGQEDCLYLNVYRPAQRATPNLPVIFYIHGGGFFCGSPNPAVLGPEYFMDTQQVIVVTVAYRLGPFGFLSTGATSMGGNFGLKDQNLALKWVRDNIDAFGGDPQSVTIFGHSAGASSVHFHMLSPASRGLFQRGIAMSGTAIAPYVDILRQPREQAVQLAALADIPNPAAMSTIDLETSLRSADALKLLNAGDSLRTWNLIPLTTFRPTLESNTCPRAFLTEHPETLLKSGNYSHVPWMLGVVEKRGEGVLPTMNILEHEELREEFNKNFESYFTKLVEFPSQVPDMAIKEKMDKIIEEYLQGRQELSNATVDGFREFIGDVLFYYPFYKSLRYYLHNGDLQQNPVYLYKFNYRGPHSFSTIWTAGSQRDFGAIHYDDMIYLFRSPILFPQDFAKDSVDAALVKSYVGLFVEFAKNGKVSKLETAKDCTEAALMAAGDLGICDYLQLENDGDTFKESLQNDFDVKRMHFWDTMFGYEV